MRTGPQMQAVVPNALSNRANNCDWIHGREKVSSQCHISATKESTIGGLMNGGQQFFSPVDVFAPVLFCCPSQLNI